MLGKDVLLRGDVGEINVLLRGDVWERTVLLRDGVRERNVPISRLQCTLNEFILHRWDL